MKAMRTLLALFIALCFYGCADTKYRSATEVIVEVDADDSLKALAHSVRVRVEGGDGLNNVAQRTTRLEETLSVADFPRRVALVPAPGASADRVFVITATALDGDGAFLAEARLIGGYIAGQVRYARLVVEGSLCLGVQCEDPRSTCARGTCAEASIDVDTLSEDALRPTVVGGGANREIDGGVRDGGGDASDTGYDPSDPLDTGTSPFDAEIDAEVDAAPPVAAVFALGSACNRPGQLACSDYDSVLTLVCSGGSWQESLRCRSNERCDSRLGNGQGLCLELISECQDKAPRSAFCRGNQRMTCGPDRVTAEGEACPAGQVCVLNGQATACMADLDECAMGTDNCDDEPNACTNTLGSFMCACPSGYTGNGQGANGCVDINECAGGALAACGVGGNGCTNTPGSYQCSCAAGYAGSGGKACSEINECAAGAVAACGAGATGCMNVSGTFSCVCSPGYTGTGGKACALGAPIGGACVVASDCRRCSPSAVAVSCVASTCVCGNGATCTANNQCAGTCAGGQCVAADTSCDAADDCRGGRTCVKPGAGLGTCSVPPGAACTANSQCSGVCRPPDTEEGSAARFCQARAAQGLHCDENADCETGLICRATIGPGFHCDVPARATDVCDEDADCMSPLSCVTLSPGIERCM